MYTYIYIHTYMHTCIYCTHTYTHTQNLAIRIDIDKHTYIHAHTYIHTYIHIHTYYTHTESRHPHRHRQRRSNSRCHRQAPTAISRTGLRHGQRTETRRPVPARQRTHLRPRSRDGARGCGDASGQIFVCEQVELAGEGGGRRFFGIRRPSECEEIRESRADRCRE